MKVRVGFVSNSSSSSFIIAVPNNNMQWMIINTTIADIMKKIDANININYKSKQYYISNLNGYCDVDYYNEEFEYNINKELNFPFIYVIKPNITNIFTSTLNLYKYYVNKANEVLNYYAIYSRKNLGIVEDYIDVDNQFNVEVNQAKIKSAKFTEDELISLDYSIKNIDEIRAEYNKYKIMIQDNKYIVMLTFNRDGECPKSIEENIIGRIGFNYFCDSNIEVLNIYE